MDRGANLFWHCHAGGSAVHSGRANKRGKEGHFAYSTLIVEKKKKHSLQVSALIAVASMLFETPVITSGLLVFIKREWFQAGEITKDNYRMSLDWHLDPCDSTLRAFLGSLVTVVPQESFTFSG